MIAGIATSSHPSEPKPGSPGAPESPSSETLGADRESGLTAPAVTFQTNLCPLLATDGWPCNEGGMSSQLPQKLTLPTGKFYFFTGLTSFARLPKSSSRS